MKCSRLTGLAVVCVVLSMSMRADAAAPSAPISLNCQAYPFVANVFPTTSYGPAGADIVVKGEKNMMPCSGGAYALCYFAGPPPMPCKVDKEKNVALCECYGFQSDKQDYKYFVDINAILNTCVYIETVRQCGPDGSGCQTENAAPVCQYINQTPQALMPKADLISTFSLENPGNAKRGCTPCNGLYAGCMTAPCTKKTNEKGEPVVVCACPLFNGPYQAGQDGVTCDLGSGLVWSAAYTTSGCPSASK